MTRSRIHAGGQAVRDARRQLIAQARADGRALLCRRCGLWIDDALSGLHYMGLTVGHIVAVKDGGTDAPDNLAPEHRMCNLAARAAAQPRALIARPVKVS